MPSSKTDTAIRFPESDNQKRRIRNVTQDRRAVSRMQREGGSEKQRREDATTWTPEQTMATSMDEDGNPKPDPTAFSDGWKARKTGALRDEGMDMYDAMNQNFD